MLVGRYTRATQYCAFSAQLRPHAAKTPGQMSGDRRFDRRPWEFGRSGTVKITANAVANPTERPLQLPLPS